MVEERRRTSGALVHGLVLEGGERVRDHLYKLQCGALPVSALQKRVVDALEAPAEMLDPVSA